MSYTVPEFTKKAFHCPFCNAFAQMNWHTHFREQFPLVHNYPPSFVAEAICLVCNKSSIWIAELGTHTADTIQDKYTGRMIYPIASSAPMPHPDLPDICQADYMEARNIVSLSPRGAAALLRLVLQKLCNHLGSPKKSINNNIAEMVSQGLPESLRKMFDFVRLTGNEAVHPGEMNIQDSPELVHSMFSFINMIAEKMIAEPRQIDEMYKKLPEGKRKAADNRDGKNPS